MKREMSNSDDFLQEIIDERTEANPEFPQLVENADLAQNLEDPEFAAEFHARKAALQRITGDFDLEAAAVEGERLIREGFTDAPDMPEDVHRVVRQYVMEREAAQAESKRRRR